MEEVINANRGEDKKNFADKLAKAVPVVPGLATGIVALVRLPDHSTGLCPGAHCWMSCPSIPACISPTTLPSACITSTTTSTTSVRLLFFGMGTVEKGYPWWRKGRRAHEALLPIGITADERVCSGAHTRRSSARCRICSIIGRTGGSRPSRPFDEKCEYHVEVGEQRQPEKAAESHGSGVKSAGKNANTSKSPLQRIP